MNIEIIPVAYATNGESEVSDQSIVWLVLPLLALVYLSLAYTLFASDDPVKIDRAADLIKTLSAFFVGTATCAMT
uniref:Uncharacterized protein n=1 Tax=Candidatus Kentrum sp. LPFa TaxID=2126335 RepID=A0A450X1S5_9GAMM|nr:MAG: hypothetical protein BECKLPF1236A_GA0070988_103743 [Candidatus Kentron sp. LPFa]VFK35245.1 MAG: hypothetical protein BECKLPF1236C_GA0070990_103503 [Candidatus Kentron sp. LPFa]